MSRYCTYTQVGVPAWLLSVPLCGKTFSIFRTPLKQVAEKLVGLLAWVKSGLPFSCVVVFGKGRGGEGGEGSGGGCHTPFKNTCLQSGQRAVANSIVRVP